MGRRCINHRRICLHGRSPLELGPPVNSPHASQYPQPVYAARIPDLGPSPQQQTQPEEQIKPCEGAQILATVGPYAILSCDVMRVVDEIVKQNKHRIAPPANLKTSENS